MTSTSLKVTDLTSQAVQTPPINLAVGGNPAAFGQPRPDLDGLRVKVPGDDAIYLMDNGYRRHIPNVPTYNNLFRDWNSIHEDTGVGEIPVGTSIADGAVLAKGANTDPVYLVDSGVKRWVTGPSVMEKYYFNWDRIYSVPDILIQNILSGSAIQ